MIKVGQVYYSRADRLEFEVKSVDPMCLEAPWMGGDKVRIEPHRLILQAMIHVGEMELVHEPPAALE